MPTRTFTRPGHTLLAGHLLRYLRYEVKAKCFRFYADTHFLLFEFHVAKTIIDTIMFAVIFYYMVGLGGRASVSNFFTFLLIVFLFSLLSNQQMAMFASFASESNLQVYGAVVLLLGILFGGFILAPDTIPRYYEWAYWCKCWN
jgi:hypothetical protein